MRRMIPWLFVAPSFLVGCVASEVPGGGGGADTTDAVRVAESGYASVSGSTATFSLPGLEPGDFLVVVLVDDGALVSLANTSVTDSQGLTWTAAPAYLGTGEGMRIYRASVTSAGTAAVTATWASPPTGGGAGYVVLRGTVPLSFQQLTLSGAFASAIACDPVTTSPDQIVLAFAVLESAMSVASANGFTLFYPVSGSSSLVMARRFYTTAESNVTPGLTASPGGDHLCGLLVVGK